MRALPDQISFKLSERGENMEDQLARGAVGGDPLGDAFESDASRFEFGNYTNEIGQASTESIEPPYNESVTVAKSTNAVVEFWSVG
jgi:hypothetical protein